MSIEAAHAAIERIESDEAFATSLREAGGAEAGLSILRDAGFDVTQSEMRDAALDRFGDQLTVEQLEAVAAGRGEPMDGIAIGLVVVTAVAAAAI
jgi:predicted ribosomally synthesized peptide with nif11-like leader